MTPPSLKRTRAESVHSHLRADILSGRLTPGERLKSSDLCARYDASVGVTREALARLSSEGLVAARNHQGFVVTPLSKEDLLDLTAARTEIEGIVFKQSVMEGDVEWEGRIVSAHHVLAHTSLIDTDDPGQTSDEWVRAHSEFHTALLSGCGNRRLLRTAQSLRQEAVLYQRWSIAMDSTGKRDVPAEHRGLLEAALARDTGLAVSRLQAHIAHTTEVLIDIGGRSAISDEGQPPLGAPAKS